LATKSALALHAAFPFLNPDQLQSAAELMREGRAVSVAKLQAMHSRIPAALTANAVDTSLKPYHEHLLSRTASAMLYAGFKLIRPDDQQAASSGDESPDSVSDPEGHDDSQEAADSDGKGPDVLYWFFFPLASRSDPKQPGNVVAWEASSRSGRATYFFRLFDSGPGAPRDPAAVEAAIRRLNRVLGMLNFRRRPIYLSDDELAANPQFHRYAIAARRLPDLRQVRANFMGRAAHSSLETWQTQVDSILARWSA
jgi:hypothetical protein